MKNTTHSYYEQLNMIDQKILDLITERGEKMEEIKNNNIEIHDFVYNNNIFSKLVENKPSYY
ncbi:hypothetical protein, partial [Staphylococcus haemolyticus]|uniref:hypothetical protein n=1 Tax=Staphylococcus haemolyticus TaxID=1283 RepID=UPI0015D7FA6F